MEKRIACLGQALKINNLETFKDVLLRYRLIWQQKKGARSIVKRGCKGRKLRHINV